MIPMIGALKCINYSLQPWSGKRGSRTPQPGGLTGPTLGVQHLRTFAMSSAGHLDRSSNLPREMVYTEVVILWAFAKHVLTAST